MERRFESLAVASFPVARKNKKMFRNRGSQSPLLVSTLFKREYYYTFTDGVFFFFPEKNMWGKHGRHALKSLFLGGPVEKKPFPRSE